MKPKQIIVDEGLDPELQDVESKNSSNVKESFRTLLIKEEIKVGDKISAEADKRKINVIVDKAFLDLKIEDEEYYEKFKYKLVK